MIDWSKCYGFDLETHGEIKEYALQAYRLTTEQARIKAAAFCDHKGKGNAVIWPEVDLLRKFFSLVIKKNGYVVGWNVVFDAAWSIAAGLEDLAFQVKWLDGMLLWRHLVVEPEGEDVPRAKRKSYSLESAMKEFYPDHADFKEFDDFQATDEESIKSLLRRNKEDSRWTLKLAHKFWSQLTDQQRTAALIEARCIPLMAKTRVLGIYSSKEEAEALSESLREEAEDLYEQLITTSPEAEGINLGSPKQLQELIYDKWGLPATRFSKKTGAPSTDKYALYDLASLDKRAALLKKLREAKNNRTKYAVGTLNSLAYNGDGYVRPQAKVFSTYTSRITYGSSDTAERDVVKEYKRKPSEIVTKKVEVPVGIALHQWKRGKDYRRLIKAPTGYDLVELDFAGQEFRWMAVASGDETMLSLCAPGEDAHSYMGSKVAGVDYRELIRLNKEGDVQAGVDRKCGKFCIAEGQLVLTDKGLVHIEDISLDHRVWDSVEFVNHEGLIYQGIKEVMTYDGLEATPDHEVYTEEGGKLRLSEAAEKGYRLVRSGDGRPEVWQSGNNFGQSPEERSEVGSLCGMPLQMRDSYLGVRREPDSRKVYSVQGVCEQTTTQERWSLDCESRRKDIQAAKEMQLHEAAMRERERSIVSELRRSRNTVQVCISCGGCELHLGELATQRLQESGHRQEGQRRTLRARESAPRYSGCELEEQKSIFEMGSSERERSSCCSCVSCSENSLSRDKVWSQYFAEHDWVRDESSADKREVGISKLQTKRVYDIANAGPRHRFTVSGRLVANCNLSYQYRVSPKTATVKARVEYEMDVDELFITNTLVTYKQSYIMVPSYWQRQIQVCKSLGYAETFAGRRVQLKGSWTGRDKWPMESTSINYPIQGTGGDQKYLALAVARNMLPEFEGYFYYELHDGLFFIFPHDKTLKAAIKFNEVLSNLPYRQAWKKIFPIKFPVDCKIGPSWGELKDLEKFL